MDCPKCQQALRDGARFCDKCGAAVSASEATTKRDELPGTADTLRDLDPLIGKVLDGKYELLDRLGEGGMGAVYRARRARIGDDVAVKVLLQKFVADAASVERFRREARAAAMLRHPNVVVIHDYDEAKGEDAPAYIVMELLEGTSLRRLLQKEHRLAPERAVALMCHICAGVGAAHRRGVFHRDLKPDNVIVLPPEEYRDHEAVKVVDFGIAKLRDPAGATTLTQTGEVVGTPYYMSPEQCRGASLDARSDVYSLGAMLYEMVAGVPPFTAETATGVIAKHLFDAPSPLPPKLGVLSAVEDVIMRALAKDPADRPPDATAFARELREAERRGREELAARLEEEERHRAEEERRRAEAEARRRAEEEELHKREQERLRREAEAAARAAQEQRAREAAAQARAAESRELRAEAELPGQLEEPEQERPEAEEEEAEARASRGAEALARERPIVGLSPAWRLALPEGRRERVMTVAGVTLLTTAVIASVLFYSSGAFTSREANAPRGEKTPVARVISDATPTATSAPTPPEGMVYVPGGEFMMGRDDSIDKSERPAHKTTVAPFFIDKYEVTNEDYLKVYAGEPTGQSGRQPVTDVDWKLASEICDALGKRLPTEEEWEFAARGTDGRRYPWGNEWQKGLANANGEQRGLSDVGAFKGASPFGAFDMVGNAWEWTASAMRAYPGGRLPSDLPSGDLKVIRGGSYESNKDYATTTYRSGWPARGARTYRQTGFRCTRDVAK